MVVGEITNRADFLQAVQSNRFVVLDAGATWCGPCKKLAPAFAKLAQSKQGSAAFYKYDIDADATLTDQLQIDSVPTVVLYDTGREQERLVGPSIAKVRLALERLVAL